MLSALSTVSLENEFVTISTKEIDWMFHLLQFANNLMEVFNSHSDSF